MTSADSRKRGVKRRLDRLVERYADVIGYAEMERILQRRTQDMRERSEPAVSADDIEGWSQ